MNICHPTMTVYRARVQQGARVFTLEFLAGDICHAELKLDHYGFDPDSVLELDAAPSRNARPLHPITIL
ncbi:MULTISPECIES: hypothetical protein [unclassified Cobetia]|uniref:hypothetical protein n=1 Tax=Pseudomonadota TaxID=1224 RepID=UPI0022FF3EAC|nr:MULTISPECIES: hypothetical protein [unclassified Cobetia]MDA5564339.1 hypothetical protein [Cobetia sp. MMG027]MDH2290009.1 hypothetical protein [Cobetia sp. 10Alg 146]MDH2296050.1 hypothetical protein [Cobetia sp. 1AS1]